MGGWPLRLLPYAAALLLIATGLRAGAAQRVATCIVDAYPHDPDAFTQGLLIDDGVLFESTGLYGRSTLRRVDLATGRVERSVRLDEGYFGEGLALADDRLYQLTWQAGVVFVYDRDSFERVAHRRYAGEGWGLAWDGTHLIMSDGSATLRLLDADDFTVVRRLRVHDDGVAADDLNELEYIDGEIWANVWHADDILRIDPQSGDVLGVIDASGLRAALPEGNDAGVLNGIAWDATRRRLFVTGKRWPRLFEIAHRQDCPAGNE